MVGYYSICGWMMGVTAEPWDQSGSAPGASLCFGSRGGFGIGHKNGFV